MGGYPKSSISRSACPSKKPSSHIGVPPNHPSHLTIRWNILKPGDLGSLQIFRKLLRLSTNPKPTNIHHPQLATPVISAKGRISAALRWPEPLRFSARKALKMRLSRALGPLGRLGPLGGAKAWTKWLNGQKWWMSMDFTGQDMGIQAESGIHGDSTWRTQGFQQKDQNAEFSQTKSDVTVRNRDSTNKSGGSSIRSWDLKSHLETQHLSSGNLTNKHVALWDDNIEQQWLNWYPVSTDWFDETFGECRGSLEHQYFFKSGWLEH